MRKILKGLLRRFVLLLQVCIVASCAFPPSAYAQSHCVTNDGDWPIVFVTTISEIFDPAEADSSDNIARGIPYATGSNVTIETSDSVCAAVIAAQNALPTDQGVPGGPLNSALVYDLNGTGYALVTVDHQYLVMFKSDLTFFRAWAYD
jgi:hypothetical protein